MRVIAIEEHFITPPGFALTERLGKVGAPIHMWAEQLGDLGERRLADMDAAGIDVQVLSTPAIGVEELDPAEALKMATEVNDVLAKAVADHPDRFAGFAVLPTLDAAAAANELERTVKELGFKGALINGHTRGRFLDDQAFWPIFERAEALDVPIYLHPTPPPPQVREAYYSGLPGMVGNVLALAGWGWHCETGLHALRLVLGGVFDRFPRLQVIIGHMGENIPFSLARGGSGPNAVCQPAAGHRRLLPGELLYHDQRLLHVPTATVRNDGSRRGSDHLLRRLPLQRQR